MNDARDFTLTRKLAETPSRRSVLRGIGSGLLAAFAGERVISAQKADKFDICHYDADTDAFQLISVNGNSRVGHVRHGDYEPVWEGSCSRCMNFAAYVDATENVAIYYEGVSLFEPGVSSGPVTLGPFLAGDTITISASGTANNGIFDSSPMETGPEGRTDGLNPFGSLFGVMGNVPFHIGDGTELTVTSNGALALYYFDGNVHDNEGGYDVTVVACR